MKGDNEERDLLTRVAWMYYFGGKTHQEIAKDLSFSRIKVTRLLKQAMDTGVVHTSIDDSYFSLFGLEDEIRKLGGLTYAVVVPSLPDTVDSLSRGTAHLCSDIIGMQGKLGIGLSRSLGYLHKYVDKKKCDFTSVVSLCGTARPDMALTPLNVGYSVAQALGIDFYTIWAPVIVGAEVDGAALKRERFIATVLDMAKNVDYALVGIGNFDDSLLVDMKFIAGRDFKEIKSTNVVGEIIGTYFTLDGEIKHTVIDDRVISVGFPMKCPVIAAAGGKAKAKAIVGAIRSGILQGLVTDEEAALEIVKLMR